MNHGTCIFCKSSADYQKLNPLVFAFNCEICGDYYIPHYTKKELEGIDTINGFLVNCISENIRSNSEGITPFWVQTRAEKQPTGIPADVIVKYLEDYSDAPIVHADKPNQLLKLIAMKLNRKQPFGTTGITKREMYSLKIIDIDELEIWLDMLLGEALIERDVGASVDPNTVSQPYWICPPGWIRVNELFSNVGSRKAFIAMWFGNPERIEMQTAIEQACDDHGWKGFTIDREEFLGGITDEIIAKINESRFVIAEFSGNRHGVYYEAGYAEGKGIPVIYVVKEGDDVSQLHFDTRHLNYITWNTPDELRRKLANRIGAVINK